MKLFAVALLTMIVNVAMAQTSIVGVWKTMDDETGLAKSHVEIYEQNGKYYGKVIKILDPNKQNSVCGECDESDSRYNKKVLGMVIVTGLVKDGDEYTDGEILDPNKGEIYDCEMWLENGKLMVRGYIAFFYRTQTWYKVQ